jgi:hypothetical protein
VHVCMYLQTKAYERSHSFPAVSGMGSKRGAVFVRPTSKFSNYDAGIF